MTPKVATLGINPSSAEFLDRKAVLLEGAKRRRLATLPSLGIESHAGITDEHAATIVDDCAAYFKRHPYGWFNPLDKLLVSSLKASYFDGTACHLDLVQWATKPFWGNLLRGTRSALLAADLGFLKRQLQEEHYQVIVVNGRTVLNWVEEAGLVRWERVRTIAESPSAEFFLGRVGGTVFVGWSCNLQSQPGARRHIPRLAELVAEYGAKGLA